MSTVHVAFTVYDKDGDYTRHLAAAVVSVLENTKFAVQVHVLHDNTLTAANKNRLEKICGDYQQQISFYPVVMDIDPQQYPALRDFSIGTMFRLKILDILTALEKVIYLDNDMIFTLDVGELWQEDISEYPVGVVADPCTYALETIPSERMQFYRKVPLMNTSYFNAGMVYFNLKELRCRKYDLFGSCIDFLNQHPDAPVVDQDALNFMFQKTCKFLDEKYNRLVSYYMETCRQRNCQCNAIWHFAGHKPWELRSSPLDNLYWQYLRLTPWAEDYDIGVIYDSFVYHGEQELLELRLQILYEVVDYFIIIEMGTSDIPGGLTDIRQLYPKFSDKIIAVRLDVPAEYTEGRYTGRNLAENYLKGILQQGSPSDLILLSAIEAIPNPFFLKQIAVLRELIIKTPLVFEHDVYQGCINVKTKEKQRGTIILRRQYIHLICDTKDGRDIFPQIDNGGWLFSHLGKEYDTTFDKAAPISCQEIGIEAIERFIVKYPQLYKEL